MFAWSSAPGSATSATAILAGCGGLPWQRSPCGARRLFPALCGARRLFPALRGPGVKPGPRGTGIKSGILMVHPAITFRIDGRRGGGNTAFPGGHRRTHSDRFPIFIGLCSSFKLFGHAPIDPKILLRLVAPAAFISV